MDTKETLFYDRQIRLWGFDAQERLKNTVVSVLFHKSEYINTIGHELVKNLVLVGIGTVSLTGRHTVTAEMASNSLFYSSRDIGGDAIEALALRTQELNDNIRVLYSKQKTLYPTFEVHLGSPEKPCALPETALSLRISNDSFLMFSGKALGHTPDCCCKEDSGDSLIDTPFLHALSAMAGGIATQKIVLRIIDQSPCLQPSLHAL
ncbi:MAG: SMT3/SUMO-activating complex, AOS1/RAD31 component [Amphiamblys sp. WSBS2006]|nr:MAG: SMT3/SUMO-activating complex, AOS1/RAD31 component [Amphiamblys sp. WSBS2006]